MDVLAPFNRVEEVAPLLRAGAAEVYCAVLSPTWRARYTNVAGVSKEEWSRSSLGSYRELEEAAAIAHGLGARVSVAFNQDNYSAAQYPLLLEEADEAVAAGADALIIADVALMVRLRERGVGCEVHASSVCAAFNARAARFLAGLGASRVILPHHLTLDEVRSIARGAPEVALEAFVLNSRCPNVEGFCTFLHALAEVEPSGLAGPLCGVIGPGSGRARRSLIQTLRGLPPGLQRAWPVSRLAASRLCPNATGARVSCMEGDAGLAEAVQERFGLRWATNVGGVGCGACSLGAVRDAGIRVVKVQGRVNPTAKKLADVRFLRAAVAALDAAEGPAAFQSACRSAFRASYGRACEPFECYWPEGGR